MKVCSGCGQRVSDAFMIGDLVHCPERDHNVEVKEVPEPVNDDQ